MKVKAHKMVKLADLQTNLYVRRALDTQHATHLGELIEAGVEMSDPMDITYRNGTPEIVDGRHRREGYELAGKKDVRVRVLEFDSEAEMIAHAYRANTGGSKPPTQADTEHTVMLLLDRKESMKGIGEMLGLPPSIARKYVNSVKSRITHTKLQAAAASVTDGEATVSQAANVHDVDIDKLKDILSGRKKKHSQGAAEVKRTITKLHSSLSIKLAGTLKKLIDKFEDGEVTEKQVRDIFKHVKTLRVRGTNSVSDWEKRFEGTISKSKKAA